MPGSWKPHEFPRLTDGSYEITSPSTRKYNCIAWAAGNDTRKWWPDPFDIGFWPRGVQRAETLDAFVAAFESLGYARCNTSDLEYGFEKVAIYAKFGPAGVAPKHAAFQLEDGRWSSKLGDFEDIAHDQLDRVAGDGYGQAMVYLRRPRRRA